MRTCTFVIVAAALAIGIWFYAMHRGPSEAEGSRQFEAALVDVKEPGVTSILPASLGRFDDVVAKLQVRLSDCGKTSPALGIPGQGRLYGCVRGPQQTAKLFVNEDDNGGVANVKLIWNDWWKDVGYGEHADRMDLPSLIAALSEAFPVVPYQAASEAFLMKSTRELSTDPRISAVYTSTRGSAIDERMIVVTPR